MYPGDSITLPRVKDDELDDVPPVGNQLATRSGDHEKGTRVRPVPKTVQSYLAFISFADAQIGGMLDALRSSPYAKNTGVVPWSDHGWHLGEKLHWRKFALGKKRAAASSRTTTRSTPEIPMCKAT